MATPSPAMFARKRAGFSEEVDSGRPTVTVYSTTSGEAPVDSRGTKYGLPPTAHLKFWYECFRKVQHPTKAEAEAAAEAHPDSMPTVAYQCSWGKHWHMGRPLTHASTQTGPSALRKQWERRENKPPVDLLEECYELARRGFPFDRERDSW